MRLARPVTSDTFFAMSIRTQAPDLSTLAAEVMASLASHRQISSFSRSRAGLSIADAYRLTALLRGAFEARGEKIIGRKIGFTNRQMWAAHGVQAPIWGYCTDRTTFELETAPAQHAANFAEPRIEPEIMFGLGRPPSPTMDDSELLDCIDWVALGYEIVQSIFPGWKFAASDTIAANALHGALLVGTRHAIAPRKDAWQRELASFTIELYCDGQLRQAGGGALVLDSPLRALRCLIGLLSDDPCNPPLHAGEIISTGTLTLAMPVSAGETWTTKVHGIPLENIALQLET
jgi:2-oxo-3-hexenedioate decarboxylase